MFKDTQLKKINVQVISKDKCYLTATWSREAKIRKIIKYRTILFKTLKWIQLKAFYYHELDLCLSKEIIKFIIQIRALLSESWH